MQGFVNLYRPNNQTLVEIITIGLGTTFIGTLYFVRDMLIDRVTVSSAGNQGNMVLFDVQTGQQQAVINLVKQYQLPVLQQTPIVTIRMTEIKGFTPQQAERDSGRGLAFESELRVTYRDSLAASEKIIAGKFGPLPAGGAAGGSRETSAPRCPTVLRTT